MEEVTHQAFGINRNATNRTQKLSQETTTALWGKRVPPNISFSDLPPTSILSRAEGGLIAGGGEVVRDCLPLTKFHGATVRPFHTHKMKFKEGEVVLPECASLPSEMEHRAPKNGTLRGMRWIFLDGMQEIHLPPNFHTVF